MRASSFTASTMAGVGSTAAVEQRIEEAFPDRYAELHMGLLRYMGVRTDGAIWDTFFNIAAVLAVVIIQLLRMFAIPRLQDSLQFLSFDVTGTTYVLIYVALVGAGLIIGLIGSALAMRRYLKV